MIWRRIALLTPAAVLAASLAACSAKPTADNKPAEPAGAVAVGNLVFVSGAVGTTGDAEAQVDEVIRKTNELLAPRGLDIGDMIQHTIYIKDGVSPMAVLNRFHATATSLAPSLKTEKSVGTIVRLPEFPNPDSLVMVDLVAATPKVAGERNEFNRIDFTFGPAEISETIAVDPFIFVAGTEAMDFEHGTLVPTIEEQVDVIVNKLQFGLQKRGLSVGDMISHNLYVKKGTDPLQVIQLFHAATHKLAPQLQDKPSVGTLVIVDGMAADGFLLEMDAVAVPPSVEVARVPYDTPIEIARTVTVGDIVMVSGIGGIESGKPAGDAVEQAAIAAKEIHASLGASGAGIGDMVKYKIYVKTGADVEKVRARFIEEAARLAPSLKTSPAAETLAIVEGLAQEQMQVEVTAFAAKK